MPLVRPNVGGVDASFARFTQAIVIAHAVDTPRRRGTILP